MVLYNVTVSVNPDKSREWLHYMRTQHIPQVIATGAFRDWKICRIHAEEEGGEAYSIQYVARDAETLNAYLQNHAPALQQDHTKRFGSETAAFRTVLSILDEGSVEPLP
jgi:hypothetical protein